MQISILLCMIFLLNDKYLIYFGQSTQSNSIQILQFIVLYSPVLPVMGYGFFDLLMMLSKQSFEKKIQAGVEGDEKMIINNPNTISNLGEVTHVLMDKTGTLTTGEYTINSIYLNRKLYILNKQKLKEKLVQYQKQVLENMDINNMKTIKYYRG